MYFVPISFYVGSIVAHIMTVKYCIFPFKSISSFVTSNDICCLEVFYDLLIIFSCLHGSRIAPTALPVPDILPSHHSYETLFYILKSVSLTVPNKEIRKILLVLKPKQSCCWVVCGRGQELSSGRKFLWVAVFLWESWPWHKPLDRSESWRHFGAIVATASRCQFAEILGFLKYLIWFPLGFKTLNL